MSCNLEEALKRLQAIVEKAPEMAETLAPSIAAVTTAKDGKVVGEEYNHLPDRKSNTQLKEGSINIYSTDKNGFESLSNLAVRPFTFKGKMFQSVEHAYQSLKSGTGLENSVYEKDWSKGGLVKRGTRGTKTENDWNIKLMRMLMEASFNQNPEAQKLLRSTGNATLTHNVNDKVWRDVFPKILEDIRSKLQDVSASDKQDTDFMFQQKPTEQKLDIGLYNKMKATLKRLYPEIELIESTSRLSRDMVNVSSMFQMSNKLKQKFQEALAKSRPDLVASGEDKTLIKDIEKFVDKEVEVGSISEKDKASLSNITFQWSLKGNVKIREDFEKVMQAFKIARQKGLDLFQFSSPNDIVERYATVGKEKAINPDNISEFTNKKDMGNGVVTYDVGESKEAQLAARKVIDTHWGKDSNPWCLLQSDSKGGTTDNADHHWKSYKGQKRIAFHNGKLLAFYAGHKWWDRRDHDSLGIRVIEKIPEDTLRRSRYVVINDDRVPTTVENYNGTTSDNYLVFPEFDKVYNRSDITFTGNPFDDGTYTEWKDNEIVEKTQRENKEIVESRKYKNGKMVSYFHKEGDNRTNITYGDGRREETTTTMISHQSAIIRREEYVDEYSTTDPVSADYFIEVVVGWDFEDNMDEGIYRQIDISEKEYEDLIKLQSTNKEKAEDMITSRVNKEHGYSDTSWKKADIEVSTIEDYFTLQEFSDEDIPFQKIQEDILGMADLKAGRVFVDTLLQNQDTLPHEYAHHYIHWFRNTAIVQDAIKKWGGEEALVQAIGEQAVKQKGEAYNFWRRFTAWVKRQFNRVSDKERLVEDLTNAFLKRKDLNNYRVSDNPVYASNSSVREQVSKVSEEEKSSTYSTEAIDFIVATSKDILDVGTKEEYSLYLDSIFPSSSITDILVHKTPIQAENTEAVKDLLYLFNKHTNTPITKEEVSVGFIELKYNKESKGAIEIKPSKAFNERTGNKEDLLVHEFSEEEIDREVRDKLNKYYWYSTENFSPNKEGSGDSRYSEAFGKKGVYFHKGINNRGELGYSGLPKSMGMFMVKVDTKNTLHNYTNSKDIKVDRGIYDSAVAYSTNDGAEVIVDSNTPIHILGSKKDIEQFKKWKQNKADSNTRLGRIQNMTQKDVNPNDVNMMICKE